jgi:carbon-monoxide dehydrogenase medium subunit
LLASAGEGSAFKRIMRPQGVALPILGCAVWVKLDFTFEHFGDVAICLGPIGPTPTRSKVIETMLIGQPANERSIEQAAIMARGELTPRTSKYRATADYRTEMIELLVRQSLAVALNRARTGEAVPQGVG